MRKMNKYARDRQQHKKKARKILSLEERVQALRMFEETPVYQRVADAFSCSWEQIKNVVSNRDDILAYYARCQTVMPGDTILLIRKKKIIFLGNAVYEFVKRAFYHGNSLLNETIIREKALQFRDIIEIDQFYPNNVWFNDFKRLFNIEFPNPKNIILVKPPSKSLNCSDIINYCRHDVQTLLEKAQSSKQRKEILNNHVIKIQQVSDLNASDLEDFRDAYGRDINFNDEEEIDEDEEGITIDFSNVDSKDGFDLPTLPESIVSLQKNKTEERESNLAQRLPRKAKQNSTPEQASKSKLSEQNRPTVITAAKRQKIEMNSNSMKKTSTTATTTTATTTTLTATNQQIQIPDSIAALAHLSPLQDYAFETEDFVAINLLIKLAAHYGKDSTDIADK